MCRCARAPAHTSIMVLTPMVLVVLVVARPSISVVEWTALRQFFNDTGGAAGAWHNATGWNVSDYESAPDPCDGVSWFGITDRFFHGMSWGEHIDTCTNATPGRRQVQPSTAPRPGRAPGAPRPRAPCHRRATLYQFLSTNK